MSARFLDDAARSAFDRAIKTIEAASSLEVVVAIRQKSGGYLHANALVAAVAAFAGLAFGLFADVAFTNGTLLVDPFIMAAIFAGLVQLAPGLKRVLTPRSWRREHVVRNARATFVERGVHNTIERSGLLVFISWLEQDIALVPDSGLIAKVPAAVFASIEEAMIAAMPKGGEAVARALEELAVHVTKLMPHADTDINELPDVLDEGARR